jgi:hypothetical protein
VQVQTQRRLQGELEAKLRNAQAASATPSTRAQSRTFHHGVMVQQQQPDDWVPDARTQRTPASRQQQQQQQQQQGFVMSQPMQQPQQSYYAPQIEQPEMMQDQSMHDYVEEAQQAMAVWAPMPPLQQQLTQPIAQTQPQYYVQMQPPVMQQPPMQQPPMQHQFTQQVRPPSVGYPQQSNQLVSMSQLQPHQRMSLVPQRPNSRGPPMTPGGRRQLMPTQALLEQRMQQMQQPGAGRGVPPAPVRFH